MSQVDYIYLRPWQLGLPFDRDGRHATGRVVVFDDGSEQYEYEGDYTENYATSEIATERIREEYGLYEEEDEEE